MRFGALTAGMCVAGLALAPVASAEPPPDLKDYPLAEGNYAVQADPGWLFFVVDFGGKPVEHHDYFGCGMGPDGTVGCDRVPANPPPGTNQTVASADEPGSYRFSLTPTFSREVDVLPEGRRLENGGAKCQRGYQGSVSCRSGEHGFVLSTTWGENW